jgi:hypothetical protein
MTTRRLASSSNPNLPPRPRQKADSSQRSLKRRSTSLSPVRTTVTNTQDHNPEPPKIQAVSRHSPFGALLSRTLPKYTGPHEVGVCDLEIPVDRQTFGSFTHKDMPDRTAGIALDTVLFSLFYPCDKPEKPKPVAWFPKCVTHFYVPHEFPFRISDTLALATFSIKPTYLHSQDDDFRNNHANHHNLAHRHYTVPGFHRL